MPARIRSLCRRAWPRDPSPTAHTRARDIPVKGSGAPQRDKPIRSGPGIGPAVHVLLIAAILAAAFGAVPSRAGEIKVGMSAAFSGPTRGLGIELYRGSTAYINHVNENGGVHGNTIRIIARDDGYNPLPTIKNTIHLVERDKVFLLFDYVGTPTVTRMLPLLTTYRDLGIFLFFPFTGAQPLRERPYARYVFNLRASYRQEVAALVDYLVPAGLRRIAVFYQVDAYGRSGWEGVCRRLAAYDSAPVGEATYYRGAKYGESMAEQVDILKKSGPDAIISIGAYAACAAFIRDARDAGLDVPIANVSFVDSENQLKLLLETGRRKGKDYTRNLINSQVVPSYREVSLPAVAEYRQLMTATELALPEHLMDDEYTPHRFSPVSLEGFLNAKLLVEILRRMGPNPRTDMIRETVETIRDYDIGIDAPVTFAPDRRQGLNIVFLTTVEDGRFVPLGARRGFSAPATSTVRSPVRAPENESTRSDGPPG